MTGSSRASITRGALLALLLCACSPAEPRNLVLISLDTVRADHLPTYGYARNTAPTLDELARRALVFSNAFAQDTNTSPSHGSMFTGLYPHEHGSTANGRPLDPAPPTMAEILTDAGFRTAAFVSGYTMKSEASGLDRGFEIYDDAFTGYRRDGRLTANLGLDWLAERAPGERFFLFLHFYDVHGPYLPKAGHAPPFVSPDRGRFMDRIPPYQQLYDAAGRALVHLNDYVDRYDALIWYVDGLVADVLRHLDLEETVVVVLSDHGETLGERFHPLDHGAQLFDEQIRIPLILSTPGIGPARIDAAVESVDLLPTLLELLGAPMPDDNRMSGESLAPLLRGHEGGRPFVFSAARTSAHRHADRGYKLRPHQRIYSVRSEHWKLILYPALQEEIPELYDLARDPAESENVAAAHPQVRDVFLKELNRWHSARGEEELDPSGISAATREALQALGYVDD